MSGGKSGAGAVIAAASVIAFLALMLGVVGAAIAPAALKITAPILCPDGTLEAVVVRSVSYPEPGTTSVSGRLYCLDSLGCATLPNEALTLGVLFAMAFCLLSMLLGPVLLLARRPKNRLLVSDS